MFIKVHLKKKIYLEKIVSFHWNNEQNTAILKCIYNASSSPWGAKFPIENRLRELQETTESKW